MKTKELQRAEKALEAQIEEVKKLRREAEELQAERVLLIGLTLSASIFEHLKFDDIRPFLEESVDKVDERVGHKQRKAKLEREQRKALSAAVEDLLEKLSNSPDEAETLQETEAEDVQSSNGNGSDQVNEPHRFNHWQG